MDLARTPVRSGVCWVVSTNIGIISVGRTTVAGNSWRGWRSKPAEWTVYQLYDPGYSEWRYGWFRAWNDVGLGGTPATYGVEFPLSIVAFPAAVLPLIWLRRRWKAARAPQPGHCGNCGYDLRATPDRCPECGALPGGAGPVSSVR